MVGEILDLSLQVDNAVVRHVRHLLYIAVLAKLICVREITAIFFPVTRAGGGAGSVPVSWSSISRVYSMYVINE